MTLYRDPLASRKNQIAIKRALVEDRESAISPVLRALLPAGTRESLEELQRRASDHGESLEALEGAEAALDALLALYDEALAEPLRGCDTEMADPPRPAMPPPWLFEEPDLRDVREAVSARLLQVHPEARVVRWGDYTCMGRFWMADAPCALVVTARVVPDAEMLSRHHSSLRTTVPAALGALDVCPERPLHAVGRALGLVHEVKVGDPSFDGRFWVTGAPVMSALLTTEVRGALEELVDQSPVLHVGGGLVTLSWSGHWKRAVVDAVPDAALRALGGIRNAIAFG